MSICWGWTTIQGRSHLKISVNFMCSVQHRMTRISRAWTRVAWRVTHSSFSMKIKSENRDFETWKLLHRKKNNYTSQASIFLSQAKNTSVRHIQFYVGLSKLCYTNNDYIYYYSFAYLFYQLKKQITCCWKKRNYGIRFVAAHIQKIICHIAHVAILNFEIHHSDRITIQKFYATM